MTAEQPNVVRCTSCRGDYVLDERGALRCPDCGGVSWVSADIAEWDETAEAALSAPATAS